MTEFLPVSSSGHLVLGKSLLGFKEVGITVEIVTHFATAAAVIIFLRKRLGVMAAAVAKRLLRRRQALSDAEAAQWRLFWLVLLGTVPAGVVGLALEDRIKPLFTDPSSTSAMLVVTGAFLLVTRRFARERAPLGWRQALAVGVAQAVAVLPGISRSGMTVGTGLALGVERRAAFEFSLLLSLPAIIGATALEAARAQIGGSPWVIVISALAAFAVGYAAIILLLRLVIRNRFHVFGYYLIPAGILALALLRVR